MKKIICLLLLVTLCLVSCGDKTENSSYKNDVSVDALVSEMYTTIGNASLTEADEGWVALNIPIDTSLCESSVIYISATGSSNLFGVFKATSDENAQKILEQSESYLETLEANWMSEYLPEELPKIQNAVCKKCGLYVTFLILEDDARDSASELFENQLKA